MRLVIAFSCHQQPKHWPYKWMVPCFQKREFRLKRYVNVENDRKYKYIPCVIKIFNTIQMYNGKIITGVIIWTRNAYEMQNRTHCYVHGTHMQHATLQWCHNGCNGVSDHQHHDCLFNRLFRHRSEKIPKLRVTGLCEGNSPVTG